MGLFRKKKRMIDVRELHKRYGIPMPAAETEGSGEIVTDSEGFVEVGGRSRARGSSSRVSSVSSGSLGSSSGTGFFNFMDSSSSPISNSSSMSELSSKTTPSEDLRKISRQISDLDNKLYKMEQRIELLERKAGVSL